MDPIARGKRLTNAYVDVKRGVNVAGWIPDQPLLLAARAAMVMGRGSLPLSTYCLARMIRSEGAAAGRIRAHVALNDAAELGWDVPRLITYSTHPGVNGFFGEQFTPASRAPLYNGQPRKSSRRYSSAKDPYAGDVTLAELVQLEHGAGDDPSGGAVKFVDRDSLSSQEGARTYDQIVLDWGREGLRPFTLPGESPSLVVFRRIA